jgi:hypothetical protein
MSHAVSDAILKPLAICHCRIRFSLGVQFRLVDKPLKDPLEARYLRMQAAPPSKRVDGTEWPCGLKVTAAGGGPDLDFDPDDPGWKHRDVYPLEGISHLGLPEPETLVVDQWLTVLPVPEGEKGRSRIALGNVPDEVPHFVSVAYPPPGMGNQAPDEVGFYYFLSDGVVRFTREAGDWLAVSLDRFWPPERSSADYILPVSDCPENNADHEEALEDLRARAAADAGG